MLDGEARAAVELWQRHLLPLSEDIATVAPAAYVWARINDALGFGASVVSAPRVAPATATTQPEPRIGWWDSLRLWRWVGLGASLVAAASIIAVITTLPHVTAPPAAAAGYMVSSIEQDNGDAGWTATMDLQHAKLVIVPVKPSVLAAGKAPELWLIPPDDKPMSRSTDHAKPTPRATRTAWRAGATRGFGGTCRRFADRNSDRQGCNPRRVSRCDRFSRDGLSAGFIDVVVALR